MACNNVFKIALAPDCNANGIDDDYDIDCGAKSARRVRPPGYCSRDGSVDLNDYSEFELCLAGIGEGLPLGCEAADTDGDCMLFDAITEAKGPGRMRLDSGPGCSSAWMSATFIM